MQSGADAFERHLIAGGELLRDSRVEDACREFEAALSVRPDDIKALGLLGLALFRRHAFADALPVYEKLVVLHPRDASYRLNLGLVYLKLGDATKAIEQLARSREIDPGQSRTVSYLGLAYARGGEYARAYEAFLQGGQSDLALEMEQHLSSEEREAILTRLSAGDSKSNMASASFAEALNEAVEALEGVEEITDADVIAAPAPEHHRGPPPPPGSREVAVPDAPPAPPPAAVEAAADAVTQPVAAVEVVASQAPAPVSEPSSPEPAAPSKVSRSTVSQMVRIAAPSTAAETAATRTAEGHLAPISLSQFATERLVRPDDGDHAFEISADGLLIVHVQQRILSRTDGVIVSGGDLGYEPAQERVRGANTGAIFGGDAEPVFTITGRGFLVVSPGTAEFAAVTLSEDILYLREDLVYAFEERVRWENGHVPGTKGEISVVQFRGEGTLAIRSPAPLHSVKLAGEHVIYVDKDVLAGWIGRVIPRLVAPAAGGSRSTPFVECSGEGIVLIVDERDEDED